MKAKIYVLAVLFLALGCKKSVEVTADADLQRSQGQPEVEYKNQLVQGLIGGQDWILMSGTAKPSPFDAGKLSLRLSNLQTDDPCNTYKMGDREVLTTVANQVGETQFGVGNPITTATFFIQSENRSDNLISGAGKIRIVEIGKEKVLGFIYTTIDEQNIVNGSFELSVCNGMEAR